MKTIQDCPIISDCFKELRLKRYETSEDKSLSYPISLEKVLRQEINDLFKELSNKGEVLSINIPHLTQKSSSCHGFYIVGSVRTKRTKESKYSFFKNGASHYCFYFEIDTASRYLDPVVKVAHKNKKWETKDVLPTIQSRNEIILNNINELKSIIGTKAWRAIIEGKALLFKWSNTVPSNVWIAPVKDYRNHFWHSEEGSRIYGSCWDLFEATEAPYSDDGFRAFKVKDEVKLCSSLN